MPGYEAEELDRQVKQWVSAYDEYAKAVERAMSKAGDSKDTASLEQIGAELQKADQARVLSKRIVKFNTADGNGKDPVMVKYVYQAVASYLSANVSGSYDFGSISVKDLSNLPSAIVEKAFSNGKMVDESYGSIGVRLNGLIMGKVGDVKIYYRDQSLPVAWMVSQPEEGITTVTEFLNGLAELDKNLVNQAYKEALKEIFTTDLSHAVMSGVKKGLKDTLEKYAGAFLHSGAGDAAQMFKDCLDYYEYVKKVSDAARVGAGDPGAAIEAMQELNFDYKTTKIKDAAVENSAKKLNEAANGINDWLSKWADGKPLPKAAIEVWKLVWSFQCPVNVAIYDSEGKQIGYVGEDDLWYDEDRIYIENYGDEKRIYSQGEPLTFKAVGQDYGTMNCSFEEYEDGEAVRRVNYYDIPISEGTEINVVSTGSSIFEDTLTVTADAEEIAASEALSAEEYENTKVTVRCLLSDENVGEVLGSGSYVRGDMVTLQAFSEEGYVFTGWMGSSGRILSSSPVYEFTARENMILTAMFSEDIQVRETDNAVVYGVDSGKSSEGAYVSASVALLNETPLQAYCVFYNENGRMLDIRTQKVTAKAEITFVTKAADADTAKIIVLNERLIPQCASKEMLLSSFGYNE